MLLRIFLVFFLSAGSAIGQSDLELVLEGFEDEPSSSNPDESDDIDDVLAGFDLVPAEETTTDVTPETSPQRSHASGSLSQRLVYNLAHDAPPAGSVDHRGLSSLRSRLDLKFEADLGADWRAHAGGHFWIDHAFELNGRSGYPSEFLAGYEREAELGELYIKGPIAANADLTFGRQIVIWGRSDLFRVTDVLNPIDSRLPGLTDIEDTRLPVTMAEVNLYSGPWNLSLLAIPERRFNKLPVPGSDFFTAAASPPSRDAPANRFGRPEYGLALAGVFSNWDLSAYAANVFDDRPHVAVTSDGPQLRHNRIWMIGAAGNFVSGNWLLKAELAALTGLRFSNVPDTSFTRLSVLAGAEYSGLADTTMAVEAVNYHLVGFDDRLKWPPAGRRKNEPGTAFRISRRFRNDSIEVTLLALHVGLTGNSGAVHRAQLAYDWTDAVELTAGIVMYRAGEQIPFRGIGDNDRLFLSINYHF